MADNMEVNFAQSADNFNRPMLTIVKVSNGCHGTITDTGDRQIEDDGTPYEASAAKVAKIP